MQTLILYFWTERDVYAYKIVICKKKNNNKNNA